MERQGETASEYGGIRKVDEVTPDLLTRKVAAAKLSISTRTLDRMANSGLIEKIFIGGAVRFRSKDIDQIVEAGI